MLGPCWSTWRELLVIQLSGMDLEASGSRLMNGDPTSPVDPFNGHNLVGISVLLRLLLVLIFASKPGLNSYSFKIPQNVPDGQYLLRIEHIGVHNAANYAGAQFFVACAQIKVTGGGNGTPGPLVSFPGAYSNNDPGIYFNTYYPPVS